MKNLYVLLSVIIFYCSCINAGINNTYLKSEVTPTLKYLKSIEITETKSGMDPIDCVYVINLDVRPKRWERMQSLLNERGINPNRVSAVNGWEIPNSVVKELAGPYPVGLQGGPLGALLSHFSIYKDAYDRGYKLIWILEDDADFLEDIRQIPTYLSILSRVDPEWDIFYTDVDCRDDRGGYFPFIVSSPPRPDQEIMPFQCYSLKLLACNGIFRALGRYGCTSMIISRSGLEKIVNYLSHVYVATAIDCDLHFIPGIREYVPAKEIVTNLRGDATSDTKPWSSLNNNKNVKK